MDDNELNPDNRLSHMDQAMFLTQRATGRNAIVQCVWVYQHPVDLAALRRFHRSLGLGLLGRRIERSPLPFARARWVSDRGPVDIDIARRARPRAELSDWLDDRGRLPVDAERGPGWHLGVLPLIDGSTAMTLVASHCLVDGLGIIGAVADAAADTTCALGYPPPRSRPRLRALVQDARQTVQGMPEIRRVIAEAVRTARIQRAQTSSISAPPLRPIRSRGAGRHESVIVPAVAIHVDLDEWDRCAEDRGGTSHHLAAGFAAKLAERLGRRRTVDGAVTLQIPLSGRIEGDTRANTLSFVSVSIDPTRVTSDLSDARTVIRRTFEKLRQAPEQVSPLLPLAPLAPFVPKPVLKHLTEAAFCYTDLPVALSSMGEVPPIAGRPDGSEAEYVFGRGMIQRVMRRDLERAQGELALFLLRGCGQMCITVTAYRPGGRNTKSELRDLVAGTLAEFGLRGVIE
ncbi:wax ester/triacylglycerol synthase family O-acyltransferase [[Mycobacterium] nativiensis]|uniref:Wax ester/triacylglycerol synthase family O-acyltransferase n=1 Tax=[Mycobacterium] nativiensis TaxID=2855503 RepID=A0ABU5Y120_9MYCO|nr:wax ester/triacylglycerol synthase family O-acyltransferase [Mycolicibacter sp. MYC340]MEB3032891.1 wax ester/triacylglycerol synthase family O-acyltransferase [Mycolicibacter sp. MYC340]